MEFQGKIGSTWTKFTCSTHLFNRQVGYFDSIGSHQNNLKEFCFFPVYIVITLEICCLVLNRIAVEDLARVFDRFWRAEQSRSYHLGGSGLGLAIAKDLVEQMHGEIQAFSPAKHTASSITDGPGTTFIVWLPV